jgi:hypothetical protein
MSGTSKRTCAPTVADARMTRPTTHGATTEHANIRGVLMQRLNEYKEMSLLHEQQLA